MWEKDSSKIRSFADISGNGGESIIVMLIAMTFALAFSQMFFGQVRKLNSLHSSNKDVETGRILEIVLRNQLQNAVHELLTKRLDIDCKQTYPNKFINFSGEFNKAWNATTPSNGSSFSIYQDAKQVLSASASVRGYEQYNAEVTECKAWVSQNMNPTQEQLLTIRTLRFCARPSKGSIRELTSDKFVAKIEFSFIDFSNDSIKSCSQLRTAIAPGVQGSYQLRWTRSDEKSAEGFVTRSAAFYYFGKQGVLP